MPDGDLIRIDEIRAAHDRIRPYIERTPLVAMADRSLVLKAESLQPVGSFKLRAAINTLLTMTAAQRARGVVAHSSGNHAIAVAHAGAALGVDVTVVMPSDAPRVKLERTRSLGASVVLVGPSSAERTQRAIELSHEHGLVPVEPYDSRAVLAATATIAVEILEDLGAGPPPVIYVPVSGGGLAGGIAAGAKLLDPGVRIVAVEPEVAADYLASHAAGERRPLPAEQMARTAADGLRVQQVGAIPWTHLEAFVDDIVTVSEGAIRGAAAQVLAEAGLVAEPSGAVSVAAALAEVAEVAEVAGGGQPTRVAVLTGSNTDATPDTRP